MRSAPNPCSFNALFWNSSFYCLLSSLQPAAFLPQPSFFHPSSAPFSSSSVYSSSVSVLLVLPEYALRTLARFFTSFHFLFLFILFFSPTLLLDLTASPEPGVIFLLLPPVHCCTRGCSWFPDLFFRVSEAFLLPLAISDQKEKQT